MELKMTDRDKVLLIILVVLVVVFGVVMIPSYGIMASINSIKDSKQKIEIKEAENHDFVTAFVENCEASGITDPEDSYANARRGAVNYINEKIFEAKYDAVKVSQISLTADSTSVAREWLIPLGYANYEYGTDVDKLLNVDLISTETGYSESNFDIGPAEYSTKKFVCEMNCTSFVENFDYAVENYDGDLYDVANMLMIHRLLTERGSVYISDGQGVWTINENGKTKWSLALVIPQNSKVEEYKLIVRECPSCGAAYSALDGLTECEECHKPLPVESAE